MLDRLKINFKRKIGVSLAVLLLVPAVVVPVNTSLASNSLDYLNNQIQSKTQQKNQMQQQNTMIQQQISTLTTQIGQTQSAISDTQSKILQTQKNIDSLNQQIKQEEDNLAAEKEKLNQIITAWYMQGDSGLLESILGSSTVSGLLDAQEQFDSVKQSINDGIDKITAMKADLDKQKNDQTEQLNTLGSMRNDQISRQSSLESSQHSKNNLLNHNQDEINDLSSQISTLTAQAATLKKQLTQVYSSGGGTPAGSDLKSANDWWYYSQRSGSWAGIVLNPSAPKDDQLTFAQAGCLLTSLAMVADYYHSGTTPTDIFNAADVNPYSGSFGGSFPYGDVGITIVQTGRVNWDTVNNELRNGHPVIVSVYTGSGPRYNSDGSNHFIVIKGVSNGVYQIQDPYWSSSSYNISSVISMKVIRGY